MKKYFLGLIALIILSFNAYSKPYMILGGSPVPRDLKNETEKKYQGNLILTMFDDEDTSNVTSSPFLEIPKDSQVIYFSVCRNYVFYRVEKILNEKDTKYYLCEISNEGKAINSKYIRRMDNQLIAYASISNDGKEIVFVQRKDYIYNEHHTQSSEINVYDIEQDIIRNVAPLGFYYANPVFSPDDKTIAFYRAPMALFDWVVQFSKDGNGYVPCLVPASGGPVEVLTGPSDTFEFERSDTPNWSPDGELLFYSIGQYDDSTKKTNPKSYCMDLARRSAIPISNTDRGKSKFKGQYFYYWDKDGGHIEDQLNNKKIMLFDQRKAKAKWLSPSQDADAIAYLDKEYKLNIIFVKGNRHLKTDSHLRNEWYYWIK